MTKSYKSEAEYTMAAYLREIGVDFENEYRFAPPRRFRFDFALVEEKIAIEIEGISAHQKTRHQTFLGYMRDCEKYNLALFNGWRVIRVPSVWLTSLNFSDYYNDFVKNFKSLIGH